MKPIEFEIIEEESTTCDKSTVEKDDSYKLTIEAKANLIAEFNTLIGNDEEKEEARKREAKAKAK